MVYKAQRNSLYHAGKKGMKWGFNDGNKNGRRTAASVNAVRNVEDFRSKVGQGAGSALIGGMNNIGARDRRDLIETQIREKRDNIVRKFANINGVSSTNNRAIHKVLVEKYAHTPLGKIEKGRAVGKNFVDELLKRISTKR